MTRLSLIAFQLAASLALAALLTIGPFHVASEFAATVV
jgi:hypothetical protein